MSPELALPEWLAFAAALPLSVAASERLGVRTERLRSLALVVAALSAAIALTAQLVLGLSPLSLASACAASSPAASSPAASSPAALLGLCPNLLTAPLVALPALLWTVTLCTTPRARLDRSGIVRTALSTSTLAFAFLANGPLPLAIAWLVSNHLFLRGLAPPGGGPLRSCRWYLGASNVLLLAGVALCGLGPVPPLAPEPGRVLIAGAVLVRKGIFPFHAWIPDAFDRGRIGPSVLFCAPQLGTYVAATLVVPDASPLLLRGLTLLSLVTALYAAALALLQRDARRATGYVFVSQSALVLAGFDGTSGEALAGSLVLWISSALAFTGMARTVLALEARRGRLDLRTHHGGYEQMPLLASGFLVLACACTGFPGTLGFVGEEMLLDGATRATPLFGLLIVAASALVGLAVLRMYFSLFCGRPAIGPPQRFHGRAAVTIGLLAATLVAGGLFPRPLVASRLRAARELLDERTLRHPAAPAAPVASRHGESP